MAEAPLALTEIGESMTTSNVPLKVDLNGRVRNMRLAPSNALYALFEAVVLWSE